MTARVRTARGVDRYMNEWVLYGGLPARRKDVIADLTAQAQRRYPNDPASVERAVGIFMLGKSGETIAPPDAVPEGPTAFDVEPITLRPVDQVVASRVIPVRASARARRHPRRLK